MKKLVMTVAALACVASMVSAQTVTSANIVGYNAATKYADGDLQLLGISIGDNSTLSELISDATFTGSYLLSDADQVIAFDSATQQYTTYAFYDDTVTAEWRLGSDFFGAGVDPVLPAGSAVFVKGAPGVADVDMVVAGEVPLVQYTTNAIVADLQLISLPYSCDITLNVNEGTDLADSGATGNYLIADADQIITWDEVAQGYVTYALYDDTVTREWRLGSDFFTAGQTPTINLGQGFWYKAQSGFTWIQENPYYGNL